VVQLALLRRSKSAWLNPFRDTDHKRADAGPLAGAVTKTFGRQPGCVLAPSLSMKTPGLRSLRSLPILSGKVQRGCGLRSNGTVWPLMMSEIFLGVINLAVRILPDIES